MQRSAIFVFSVTLTCVTCFALAQENADQLIDKSTNLHQKSDSKIPNSRHENKPDFKVLNSAPGVDSFPSGAASQIDKDDSTFKVVLDPGHGGRDRGATHGNLKESEIALKVAMKLEKLLRDDPNFQVSMTRNSDRTLSLEERTLFAKHEHADLYLSIHLNASTDLRAQGKEFYFQNQLPVDEDSMFLASRENNPATPEPGTHEPRRPISQIEIDPISQHGDLRNIIDDLKRNQRIHSSSLLSKILFETWVEKPTNSGSSRAHRGGSRAIRQAPFFVIANADAPAVLVELGFITHPTEGPRLALASYQDELAHSLYEGLIKFRVSDAGAGGRGTNE